MSPLVCLPLQLLLGVSSSQDHPTAPHTRLLHIHHHSHTTHPIPTRICISARKATPHSPHLQTYQLPPSHRRQSIHRDRTIEVLGTNKKAKKKKKGGHIALNQPTPQVPFHPVATTNQQPNTETAYQSIKTPNTTPLIHQPTHSSTRTQNSTIQIQNRHNRAQQ